MQTSELEKQLDILDDGADPSFRERRVKPRERLPYF